MNILFLTYDIVWPLDSGGKIRSYNLIKSLSKSHNVTVLSFYRNEEQLNDVKHVEKICKRVVVFPRKHKFSPHNLVFLPMLPYPVALYYRPQIAKFILDELSLYSYDIIHFESFYVSSYMQYISNTATVLGTENIEWHVYDEYAKNKNSNFLRKLISIEVGRIKRFEESTWKEANACLAVSSENAEIISNVSGKNVPIIPNGVDLDHFSYHKHSQRTNNILFVGNFSYIQNTDAISYIIEQIVPNIRSEAILMIIGRNPTSDIKKLHGIKRNNVTIRVDSTVDDIRKEYKNADLLLAPIRVGSGTKFKILEAMASGLPVVTNTRGIEGIHAKVGTDVYVEDRPKDLAQRVDRLLNDSFMRVSCGKHARSVVKRHFSWESIGKKLETAYTTLLSSMNK